MGFLGVQVLLEWKRHWFIESVSWSVVKEPENTWRPCALRSIAVLLIVPLSSPPSIIPPCITGQPAGGTSPGVERTVCEWLVTCRL